MPFTEMRKCKEEEDYAMRPVFRATWPTSRVDVLHFSKYDVITWKWRKFATFLILLKYDSPSSPYLKLYAKTGIFMLNLCLQPLICNSEFHQLGTLKELCNSLGGKIYLLLSHLVAQSRLNLHEAIYSLYPYYNTYILVQKYEQV